ncbi:hypothetical protein HYFRA_00007649 [Hymenoscyphus fraxineus]|uniref:tetrahydrofolate synthase n=1 Tax=Hymenoscyphus fraxineus TaxID=746836 RepID=A0A9N9KS71_9HELO|nr:hypothetical protein HYFRA_00007649 [Hymenoscyphus fraxineus]
MIDRSYERALELLRGLKRQGLPWATNAPSKSIPGINTMPSLKGKSDLKGTPSIVGMKQWLQHLGHSPADINKLNIIHVAGTKGEGSTCAFIESFLRAHGRRTGYPYKTGLYTSPHLIRPEERIRINFKPIPQDLFAKFVFEVYEILSQQNSPEPPSRPPGYLRMFALIAFHVFIKEGIDAMIMETHHGGEYDSTNVIERPVITVITSLGMDHVRQLGPSIENIAWHKSGIFKPGALAFSAPQEPAATEILRRRAAEKAVDLQFIEQDDSLPVKSMLVMPSVQRTNCAVALAAARAFCDQKLADGSERSQVSESDIAQGIVQFSWPGRFQTVIDNGFQWFLDAAHNEMSVGQAAEWFTSSCDNQSISPATRVLIFSQTSDERDEVSIFRCLANSLKGGRIQHVILTTYRHDNQDQINGGMELPSKEIYTSIWREIHPDTPITFHSTIKEALQCARDIGGKHGECTQTLLTGSQYLVGGALNLLKYSGPIYAQDVGAG